MVELGKEGRKVRHRLRLKHRVDETQEAWISRFEDASRKATEKGEDVKQVRGGEVVFTYAYQRNSTVPVIWQWSATLYCTSSFLGFLFFLSCEYNFSPSLYSPLLRHRPLSSHRRIFQKREHLAPRCARAASLSSSVRFILIPTANDSLPSKRRRTQSTVASSRAISTLSQHSHKHRKSLSIHDDDAELPGTSQWQAKSTQRLQGKSTGKRNHYRHQNRLRKQRRRKFGCSKLSWPRHG
jgi:hypothetical protein